VVEGEADIRIGAAPVAKGKGNAAGKPGIRVYALPVRSCLIVPPGVLFSDGKTPHWERPGLENARSRILWLQMLPTGALIHTCETNGRAHSHVEAVFVPDAQLSVLTHFMLENAGADTGPLLHAYLHTILLGLDRSWAAARVIDSEGGTPLPASSDRCGAGHGPRHGVSGDAHGEALDRARQYIQSHLANALSPDQIARHAFVSVPQLKRIFRARLDTTVMHYVTERRLEEAKALLWQTSLTVEAIGEICGYPHRTHFSRAFKAHCGVSPRAFRQAGGGRSRGIASG
jgi:AraC-like DNA-binding protein